MKRLFHSSLYQFDQAQPSYWEATAANQAAIHQPLSGAQSCDVAIIGGGYTGLAAALHLARDFDVDVCVLEAGHIGWGASGRNGGFCTMGSTKLSIATQISRFGIDETRRFHQCQADAVALVRELGIAEQIDFLPQGDCEFAVADSHADMQSLQASAELAQQLLGLDVTVHSQDEFREIGYDSPQQHGAIAYRPAFALHPLRYAQGLATAAARHGARIYPHSEVLHWHKPSASHRLTTAAGSLLARQVILTGNGFMPEHLHRHIRGRPLPVQSAIVVTEPMSESELQARGWHSESPMINSKHMFFYYRMLSDRRLLFGARGDHTGEPAAADKTFVHMHHSIARMWPQFTDLDFTHQWRGLVCFTLNLRPAIGRIPTDKSVYFGYGYHGNGVNSATWSGRELAHWLAGKFSGDELLPKHLPALVRGAPPRFPLATLRRQYLLAAIGYYRLRDWFGSQF